MSQQESHTNVQDAIDLIKRGKRAEARALLMAAVEIDEENELAWLWLSAAVEEDSERILCLQNALTLNPDNEKARARLLRIQERQHKQPGPPPPQESPRPNNTDSTPPLTLPIQSDSSIKDVWADADNRTLCAYCAHEVELEKKRCPNCFRKLTMRVLSYTHVSSKFHMYWILTLSLSQLMMVQVVTDILSKQPRATVYAHGVFVPVFLILTPFLYQRNFWAYVVAQISLFITAGLLISASLFPSLLTSLSIASGTPLAALFGGASLLTGYGIRFLQLTASTLAFFLGTFMVAPDFSRDTIWLYARLNKDLRGSTAASRAHAAARRYAKRGMWATAALHWRRAQVGAPTELRYCVRLADAYLRLKFFDRALDTVESGLAVAASPEMRETLNKLKHDILSQKVKW